MTGNGKRGDGGFTLIELLIAMAIMAIIAAVAIPSYTQYVRRAQRVDATAALLRIQNEQEKYYLNNNSYASSTTDLGITTTENGYYTLSITAATPVTNYTATATATGRQLADDDCRTFTVTGQGVRAAADSSGTANTAECWR